MYDELEAFLTRLSYGMILDEDSLDPWASVLILPVPNDKQLFSVEDRTIRDFLSPNNHPSETTYTMGSILPDFPVIRQRRLESRLPTDASRLAETTRLTQVFDNGCVIHARKMRHDQGREQEEIYGLFFCAVVYDGLTLAASLYNRFVQSGLVVVCANLSRTHGTHLTFPFDQPIDPQTIDYDIETMRRDVSLVDFLNQPGLVAKSIADEFYNSYGLANAVCIDEQGQWVGDARF